MIMKKQLRLEKVSLFDYYGLEVLLGHVFVNLGYYRRQITNLLKLQYEV